MAINVTAVSTEEVSNYVTATDISGIPAGTRAVKTANGGYVVAYNGTVLALTANEVENSSLFRKEIQCLTAVSVTVEDEPVAPIDEEPSFNVGAILVSEAFEKIVEAVADQKAIGEGERYFFYHVGEKRYAKATMERTSSDIGRLVAGFALPITTTAKSKKNRLKKLNAAYGLGLTSEEIVAIANAE